MQFTFARLWVCHGISEASIRAGIIYLKTFLRYDSYKTVVTSNVFVGGLHTHLSGALLDNVFDAVIIRFLKIQTDIERVNSIFEKVKDGKEGDLGPSIYLPACVVRIVDKYATQRCIIHLNMGA